LLLFYFRRVFRNGDVESTLRSAREGEEKDVLAGQGDGQSPARPSKPGTATHLDEVSPKISQNVPDIIGSPQTAEPG